MSLAAAEEANLLSQAGGVILPVGVAGSATPARFQTFDRRMATGTVFAPTSGTLTMTSIWLPAGTVVTGITFVSGSTAESGGTHLWYALYKFDLTFMAQSTDDTGATSFAANTAFRKALTAAQTCPYTGQYFLGFMCAQSAGGTPTLHCAVAASANVNGGVTGMTPIVSATSSTSLGAAAPTPAGALTAITQSLYAFVD